MKEKPPKAEPSMVTLCFPEWTKTYRNGHFMRRSITGAAVAILLVQELQPEGAKLQIYGGLNINTSAPRPSHPHLLWPQSAQVMQPSTIRIA
ncbi:MAG: hypothetical protein EP320_10870 [Rhodobacteraceae bacterium]|nr:MAG: hypothetical protein EP320_10870 [Paracoccaceae bacterium]